MMWNFDTIKQKVGNAFFVLLLLVFTIDPANVIFHIKDILFVLFVIYNIVCFKPDFSKLPYIFFILTAMVAAYIFGEIQQSNVDNDELIAAFKAIAPMILLLWIHQYDVINLSRLPIIIGAIVCILLFWFIAFVPEAEGFIYYFWSADNTIIVSNRNFLGMEFFCLHYRTIVSFIFVFAYYINCIFIKQSRTVSNLLCMLLILHAFLISGTRSTMLLPFFLIGIIAYYHCRNMRYFKYFVYPVLGFAAIGFIVVLFKLISETDEASNVVKYGHLTSYWELFSKHPEYALWGQGPGALFYTEGFKRVTGKTEWTYLELIRNYGLFCLPILYVFFRPLIALWKGRAQNFTYVMFWTYFTYLLIAGTNPLMLTSIGMTSLLTIYSYEEKMKRDKPL